MITDEWLTPPYIIDRLGPFDLDPCFSNPRPWDTAKKHYSQDEDGLSLPWFGRVWLNPPYGKEACKWLDKLEKHGNGIALVFARTETKMFFKHVWGKAHGIFFFEGRLYFYDKHGERAQGNAGAPSCLIAYGQYNAQLLQKCAVYGYLPGYYVSI